MLDPSWKKWCWIYSVNPDFKKAWDEEVSRLAQDSIGKLKIKQDLLQAQLQNVNHQYQALVKHVK